ncbi:MAG: flagellar protein [Lachnospiraceae bacterium]|nr:flagellar protein [Lachnospiraceae bacterium]
MQIQNSPYLSVGRTGTELRTGTQSTAKTNLTQDGLSFEQILENTEKTGTSEVKFSKHAAGRLSDRNITLTDDQVKRLGTGTQQAEEKGIKESLVLVDNLAFIVNVPSSTVVTAMDQTETRQNTFTNIDGAVIA